MQEPPPIEVQINTQIEPSKLAAAAKPEVAA